METTILTQCLDLTKALRSLDVSFNISIKLENSDIQFTNNDEDEKAKKKMKSPSQKERDTKRKKVYLESKTKMDKPKSPRNTVQNKQKVPEVIDIESEVSSFLDNLLKPKVPPTKKNTEVKEKITVENENEKCKSCNFRGRSAEDVKKHNKVHHKGEESTKLKGSWKCIYDCEYVGESEEAMHSHLFRQHWSPSVSPGDKFTPWRRGKPPLMSASSRAI